MPFFDFFEDLELICGAFCATFRMMPLEFFNLSFAEYSMMFPGLNKDTAFMQILVAREEKDMSRVRQYSPAMKDDWNKWNKRAQEWQAKQLKKRKTFTVEEVEKGREIARKKLEALLTKNKEAN